MTMCIVVENAYSKQAKVWGSRKRLKYIKSLAPVMLLMLRPVKCALSVWTFETCIRFSYIFCHNSR